MLTDLSSIYLERAHIPRNTGFLANDNEFGFAFDINVNFKKKKITNNTIEYSSESITVTRAYKFDVSNFGSEDQTNIPLSKLAVLDSYKLSDGTSYYVSSITTGITLCVKKGRATFSKVMQTIFDLSKELPIPPNPYTAYIDSIGKTFGQITQSAVKSEPNSVPFASIGLRFVGNGTEKNFISKSGLYAVIMGTNLDGAGKIDINNISNDKLSYHDTAGLRYSNTGVINPYLVFRVIHSIDPLAAEVDPKGVADRISSQLIPAIAKADKAGLDSSALKLLNSPNSKKDSSEVQKALSQLNKIQLY